METIIYRVLDSIVSANSTNTEYISTTNVNNVLVESINTNVLVTGLVGPPGLPGISEDDTMYSKRIDFISDNELYRGEALVGASEDSAVWRIRRVTIINNDITEVWAGGTANFDKVWTNRLALIYS